MRMMLKRLRKAFGRLGVPVFFLMAVCSPGTATDCLAALSGGNRLSNGALSGGEFVTHEVTLNVVDPSGSPIKEFRWMAQEDLLYQPQPGVPDPNTLAVSFHRSYVPVAARAENAGEPSTTMNLRPDKYYFVSVLPHRGYAMGGARVLPGQTEATVVVQPLPLPTAQITILVYEDTFPINNAPDLPEERGLEGFTVVLEDGGGRYGIAAGVQSQDAFGNPLGTTYQRNPDGTPVLVDGAPVVDVIGSGIFTDANGEAVIRNLSPGKYGITVVPPVGQGWQQTSTIEGTKIIDAWVKAGEPPFFAEFGPPGYHVTVGFIQPFADAAVLSGGSTISGQIVNLHLGKPPDSAFYHGAPFAHTTPWVGLNDLSVGRGRGVYAVETGADGVFSIPDVPPGNYQLVAWDNNLDLIFAFHGVTVNPDGTCTTPAGTSCALGEVPVFQWFTRLEHWVFSDDGGGDPSKAGNGFMDPGEAGIPEQNVNVRWRDGTINLAAPTDGEGFVPFDETFPFFAWQVAEVDFARYKATGVTVVVDDGGAINPLDPWTFGGQLNPQPQNENGGLPYRTETGPVLTEAFQGFIGQTSVMMWGKTAYPPGENGGISGIVYYATTRAENDPALAAAEPWEPGIPGVTVNLYDATGTKLLNTTTTDSWDESLPTNCQAPPFIFQGQATDCYDGLRVFNQVRPGVFDGGYAFSSYWSPSYGAKNAVEVDGLPMGHYIVEVVPPPGYDILKEEDRNVDFGEEYVPNKTLLAPVCVGADHLVPDQFSLFPLFDEAGAPVTPARAGEKVPLCDRKRVTLTDGLNAAADFFLFTPVPIAAHVYGFILDDASNEFDPNAPQFGEKYAPPWMPVSFHDWTGREITRTYSDQYGVYNALLPSTFTANRPAPSGMSPNMVTACMNSPRFADGSPDPYFNPRYSTFCYTLQYMPGTTTYLDTPVVPVSAFAGPNQFPLDCEFQDGTPKIKQVDAPGGGPYVADLAVDRTIVITSEGDATAGLVDVPNPAYCPGPPLVNGCVAIDSNTTVARDYGFGASQGTVQLVEPDGTAHPLTINAWGQTSITATIPAGTLVPPATAQVVVTRADTSLSSIVGVTFQVGLRPGASLQVVAGPAPYPATPIQDAIDAAGPNDLILVPPGGYEEPVIMWKPVQLQGYGPGAVTINAINVPAEKVQDWRTKIAAMVAAGDIDPLPGQAGTFASEETAGVLVVAKATGTVPRAFDLADNRGARIDGFTITGASTGGGVVVSGYGDYVQISNNRVVNNSGFFHGGIRVGHPELTVFIDPDTLYQDSDNDFVTIRNNHITQNGGAGGAGGGISLCTGSDGYRVNGNYICGNYTQGDGAGIGHLGVSDGGEIGGNTIVFNENFFQGATVSGGGIYIAGAPALLPEVLSPGSGSVEIVDNLILGNSAGSGDGGGIRLSHLNGLDVAADPDPATWHTVNIFNNMIADNVAALAGGGISLQDAARVRIVHNTVANNDSTATAGEAFAPNSPNESSPQPAGIVSRAHSVDLAAALPGGQPLYSDPMLVDNIIRHNRSFYFFGDPLAVPPVYELLPDPATPVYHDLAVLGTAVASLLNPLSCVLSETVNPADYDVSNFYTDPDFTAEYFNGDRGSTIAMPEVTTAIQAPPAFDEGGNFIRLRFGPLTRWRVDNGQLYGDYHLAGTGPSDAVDGGTNLNGTFPRLALDFDGETRPFGVEVDIGADELQQPLPFSRAAASRQPKITVTPGDNAKGERIKWRRIK